jgi:hypothetical protein
MKITPKQMLVGLTIFTITAAITGCNLGDVIRTKVPPAVQKSETLPKTLTLNESEVEFDRWLHNVAITSDQWTESIENSLALRHLLQDIAMTEFSPERLAIMGLPVGGPAAMLLTFGLGTFLKRPGDVTQKAAAKEKEKSFNAGLDKGKE